MTHYLKDHILQFVDAPPEEIEKFIHDFKLIRLGPKDHILREGEVNQSLYFINKGCFRIYMIHKNGAEKTINFALENWWLADFDSLLNHHPSQLYIQAIEKSELLQISKKDLDKALQTSFPINQYFRIIHEKVRIADQRRIQYFFNLSGKELYEIFCEYNSEFVNRIPQYMLASYLGFTPEFLSKIRAERG